MGDFEVNVAGRVLDRSDWRRLSSERLVKLLSVTPGHRIAREIAAEALWPGAAPEPRRTNLCKSLHFAGRALQGTSILLVESGEIGVGRGRIDLDLDRPEGAIVQLDAASRAGAMPTALAVADDLARNDRATEAHELVDRVLERDPPDEAAHRLAIGR